MKKLIIIAAVLFSSFAVAQTETNELKSFEVNQKFASGNQRVDSYMLPEGSKIYIYTNNGVSDLVADIPQGADFQEPFFRRVLEKNVISFTEL